MSRRRRPARARKGAIDPGALLALVGEGRTCSRGTSAWRPRLLDTLRADHPGMIDRDIDFSSGPTP